MEKLKISEIFYSLQGEGARKGVPTIFIRLAGCKAKNACFAAGIRCDTEFNSGKEYSSEDLIKWIEENAKGCLEITWTGGEPLDQLKQDHVDYFKGKGYYQAIETSGLHPCPEGIDFICVSPKVADHVVKKNFPHGVTELRYVRHKGQEIPAPEIKAEYYYISPHSDGWEINSENLKHCINLCLKHPTWRMSMQSHKLWGVL